MNDIKLKPVKIYGTLIRNQYLLSMLEEIVEIQKIENTSFHMKGRMRNDIFSYKLLTALENGKA